MLYPFSGIINWTVFWDVDLLPTAGGGGLNMVRLVGTPMKLGRRDVRAVNVS